jgi:hypothetical protein
MSFEWAKLADWLKLKPSLLVGVALASGFAVLAPATWLARLGLDSLVSEHRGWFGGALLVSVAVLLALSAAWLFGSAASPLVEWWQTKRLSGFLKTLSPPEKALLKKYLDQQTTTLYFSITDGVVNGLVQKRILWRAASLSAGFTDFAFNIQPWAWDYLKSRRQLVE